MKVDKSHGMLSRRKKQGRSVGFITQPANLPRYIARSVEIRTTAVTSEQATPCQFPERC